MSNDWVVVMQRIEALSVEARDARRESVRLQSEAALKDETIKALTVKNEKLVRCAKELALLSDSLMRDNEECDAELMKENNNEH